MRALDELYEPKFKGSVIGNSLDGIDWNGMTPIS